jgi:hypothetical protein
LNALTVNLVLSTFVFWVAARLYLLPRLSALEPRTVLLPILLLHAFRHLGLMFLAPGAIYAGMPAQFAYPAITLATLNDAAPHMGPAYWIPAFWVPALLVTHYVTFAVLWRNPRLSAPARA